MKKTILFLACLGGLAIKGQEGNVGINTPNPKATLDVTGKPADITHLDGIIAPRLTGDELKLKTYTADQTGAIIYATTADSSPAGQTIEVTKVGYYYFDGTKWKTFTVESQLEKVTENGKTGWRILGKDPAKYSGTGVNAVDLSHGTSSFYPTTGASGELSFAVGADAIASGKNSMAIGYLARAFHDNSIAVGSVTFANAPNTSVFGYNSNATGDNSTALGFAAYADGKNSVALGQASNAHGERSLAAIGGEAFGLSSFAVGESVRAKSLGEVAIGYNNTDYIVGTNGETVWNPTDRLFSLGNGPDGTSNSNALTILKNGNMGVGFDTPTEKLEINGKIKIVDGSQATGKVLTSDANGIATWQTPASNYWSTNGNASTVAGTNFIGTTDNVDLVFKRNNVQSGLINTVEPQFETPDSGSTAFGYSTLPNVGNGYNSAFGYKALSSNTTGYSNTALGNLALTKNTTGLGNTAVGTDAMKENTIGTDNVAVGQASLRSNTSGIDNVAIGNGALLSSNSANYNTAIGFSALKDAKNSKNTAMGYSALGFTTSGQNNIAIGYNAGVVGTNVAGSSFDINTISTGSNNIVIGIDAGVADGTASNQLNIGNWIYGTNGNIAIGKRGTPLPVPTEKLQVYGKALFYEQTGGNNSLITINPNGADAQIDIKEGFGNTYSLISGVTSDTVGGTYLGGFMIKKGTSPQFAIFPNGNIVIGGNPSSNPQEKLQVLGKIKATNINFTGLPTFANDAAATSLSSGDMYKTATGELRIKL
ncbi:MULTISPECIES: hypothetical protein [unclassified Chryseobacterium]|uniref:hypothetical protein n=1 Tax=unclassified Chryseobacterium TaxID=2593645 RepID=UPI000D3C96C0|nr:MULTISPECIES: hypothetical protein [unclassified Chryseobacterium]MCQ4138766.1 hypothetical protein [Chryseobacterium sp. EO14]PTT71134.1 hypothetical protein DBR25_17220 [Chryseobacterium sp. HMWF001]PVV55327.1 hypothetical protein DD829_15010 [Chryseobacterium sp. HMWF035]